MLTHDRTTARSGGVSRNETKRNVGSRVARVCGGRRGLLFRIRTSCSRPPGPPHTIRYVVCCFPDRPYSFSRTKRSLPSQRLPHVFLFFFLTARREIIIANVYLTKPQPPWRPPCCPYQNVFGIGYKEAQHLLLTAKIRRKHRQLCVLFLILFTHAPTSRGKATPVTSVRLRTPSATWRLRTTNQIIPLQKKTNCVWSVFLFFSFASFYRRYKKKGHENRFAFFYGYETPVVALSL